MNRKFVICASMTMAVSLTMSGESAAVPAFPGAEGFGKNAKGGRGGVVYEVTNLNASGPGSFRACVEASGPRTCVFRVGGTIDLDVAPSALLKIENPFITIAGQTAPGDGILIKGGQINITTSDVIIRHLRIRTGPGPTNFPAPGDSEPISLVNSKDVILDHLSTSWGSDNNIDVGPNADGVTVQWSILSEPLNCPTPRHPKGCHGANGSLRTGNTSFHHNLLAHSLSRNMMVSGGNHDYVNNVMYNRGAVGLTIYPAHSIIKANLMGNYYLAGANTANPPFRLIGPNYDRLTARFSPSSLVYLKGNIDPQYRPDNSRPETDLVYYGYGDVALTNTRLNYPNVTETDAFTAFDDVLGKAGATVPKRDPVDTRIVNDVRNKTGKVINMPSEVGGYPTLQNGTPPTDTDHDGMPDFWENANGLNPNNAADRNGDLDSDGYTNLEEYLNELAGDQGGGTTPPPSSPGNTVDSTFYGYTTAPIDDEVIDASGGRATTWASADNASDHWIAITFPNNRTLNSATIHWAYNNTQQKYMTSNTVHVQTWNGSGWNTVATLSRGTTDTPSTSVTFPDTTTSGIRFYQPAGMGNPTYQGILWVTEVDYSLIPGADGGENVLSPPTDLRITSG